MNLLKLCTAIVVPIAFTSCATAKKVKTPPTYIINLECSATPDTHYNNLTHGINIFVTSSVTDRSILDASECTLATREKIAGSVIRVDPTIKDFVSQSIGIYARSLGINVGGNINSDYNLHINIRNFSVVLGNQTKDRGIVEMEYSLTNADNETLLRQSVRGRFTANNPNMAYSYLLDRAFSDAISMMNWDGIVSYLKTPKRAEQQPLAQVKGDGNTALEKTIIRWNVESRPAGADVYWRVVSSTPDVKNTNSAFLGSTPYESTESFDIKGLSYENSGNVQIEIKCEKPGYIPQTRRFNLNQVIDQKEISTKFNLVKDEE